MRMVTERLKINKRDTQKDGIEYPNRVERVMMTSAGRPRLHPEIRPRMIPSHMVAAAEPATMERTVWRRGGDKGGPRTRDWVQVGEPLHPQRNVRDPKKQRALGCGGKARHWA